MTAVRTDLRHGKDRLGGNAPPWGMEQRISAHGTTQAHYVDASHQRRQKEEDHKGRGNIEAYKPQHSVENEPQDTDNTVF